jgi:hypothetical protein
MSITQILAAAQGGRFFENVGSATGLETAAAEKAVGAFAPAIAAMLKDRAAQDPDAFEQLLDLLEDGDGSDLNDPDAITSSEAVSDGREILEDLYGSATAAQTALGKLAPALDTAAVAKLGAISATSVLAALSASAVQGISGNTQQAAERAGGGGFLSIIIAAVLKGFMQSAQRQLAPRRRRRRYASYSSRRRTTTRKRRKSSVGLDDLFKDIFGGRR